MLRAQHGAEWAQALQRLAGDFAQLSAARTAAVSSAFAAKMATLSPVLSLAERAAAMDRIKGEEADAMAAVLLDLQREGEQQRRGLAASLTGRHKAARTALAQRQRRERAVLALRMRGPRRSTVVTRTPRLAVRRLLRSVSLAPGHTPAAR